MKKLPLSEQSLLTRSEVEAELQIGDAKLARILARVKPVLVGDSRRDRRWLWRDILASLPGEGEPPIKRGRAEKRAVVAL